MKDFCIAGFGEVMLRLAPQGKKRFAQVIPGSLDATFGGGEANVCASIAMLGGRSRYLTALPDNPIVKAFAAQLAGLGCDVSRINYAKCGRMGVYYAEHGSNMRGSNVVYDREGSTISMLAPEDYDFEKMLDGVTHLHLSGITPSLTENAFKSTLAIAQKAAEMNITVSIDLNYRKKLWNWKAGTAKNELARCCMSQIVPFADIIIGNEEDASDVFGINAKDTAIDKGELNIAGYADVASQLSAKFPKAKFVAITLRESISANDNNWAAMLYANGEAYFSKKYAVHIVDRVGGGDSFGAGLIYGLLNGFDCQKTIEFAVAASCLKHSIETDFNYVSVDEVTTLMKGDGSGRVQR